MREFDCIYCDYPLRDDGRCSRCGQTQPEEVAAARIDPDALDEMDLEYLKALEVQLAR